MTAVKPWAVGPFELLVHAEGHWLNGKDFDRRIALISFDDAIEVAITTYLKLHPIMRGGRTYTNADVIRWLDNFHTKLDFLNSELAARGLSWLVDRADIIWCHTHRNEQYHGGVKGIPEIHVLRDVRKAALWIFSVLFDVAHIEAVLAEAIASQLPPPLPEHDGDYDIAIDREYEIIDVGESSYYASDVLFEVDYVAYKDLGARLCGPDTVGSASGGGAGA